MDALANQPIVIDSGSGVMKAGFAGDGAPKVAFPSFIGRPKYRRVVEGGEAADADFFIGNQANELRGILRLQYPMEHGQVVDWDAMEMIWSHIIHQELRIQPEDHPVLLTEVAMSPAVDREKVAEIFFEKFNVPAIFFAMEPVLSLYSGGRTTGLVLESGEGVTQVVPVFEGFSVAHAIERADLAGRDVSEYLQLLLRRAGRRFLTSAEFQTVRDVKERMCFVASNLRVQEEADEKRRREQMPGPTFTLPDGHALELGPERFRAAEVMFRPSLIGSECSGLEDLVTNSIARADLDIRRVLYQTLVLSGGNTLLRGMGERLLRELRAKAPRGTKIKIFAPPDRQFSTWVGGSILMSLPTFQNSWISSKEWHERGPAAVRNRLL